MSGISASLTKWFSERPQWLQIGVFQGSCRLDLRSLMFGDN